MIIVTMPVESQLDVSRRAADQYALLHAGELDQHSEPRLRRRPTGNVAGPRTAMATALHGLARRLDPAV